MSRTGPVAEEIALNPDISEVVEFDRVRFWQNVVARKEDVSPNADIRNVLQIDRMDWMLR